MFLTDFYRESQKIAESCRQISFEGNGELVWSGEQNGIPKPKALYAIRNLPPYLKVTFTGEETHSHLKYPSIGGFAINLETYPNLDTFLSRRLGKKVKGHLKRALKRLEFSYDICYKHLYGNTDQGECLHYLGLLKEMITNRFAERNQENHALKTWDQLEKTVPALVAAKKASIFAISNGGQPLAISVSYHFGRMLFIYSSSYDIDFGKFSLGNIIIYKKLEWCYENKYRILDMGWGALDYKSRWCNYHYELEHHLLCPKNSVAATIVAALEGNKTKIKSALLNAPVLKYFKALVSPKKQPKPNEKGIVAYSLMKVDTGDFPSDLTAVDLNDQKFASFRSLRNDFIYLTQELYQDVGLYSDENSNTFYFKGRNHINKIVPAH